MFKFELRRIPPALSDSRRARGAQLLHQTSSCESRSGGFDQPIEQHGVRAIRDRDQLERRQLGRIELGKARVDQIPDPSDLGKLPAPSPQPPLSECDPIERLDVQAPEPAVLPQRHHGIRSGLPGADGGHHVHRARHHQLVDQRRRSVIKQVGVVDDEQRSMLVRELEHRAAISRASRVFLDTPRTPS